MDLCYNEGARCEFPCFQFFLLTASDVLDPLLESVDHIYLWEGILSKLGLDDRKMATI